MNRRILAVLCFLVVIDMVIGGAIINDYFPQRSNIFGRHLITIEGCGFREYNNAVCSWDGQYYSPVHVILNDNLIYCDTPILTKADFEVLPKTLSLYVVFDGSTILKAGDYVFGPSLLEFSPVDGYIEGGEEFRVVGFGFSDFEYANVSFDGAQCINTTIVSNFEISCIVPPGEFAQKAVVNVMFENNTNYFLHFTETFWYGPYFWGTYPQCGNILGGTRVTLIGENLDDPFVAYETDPQLAVPQVEVIFNGGAERAYCTDVKYNAKSNMITFTTPSIGTEAEAYGQIVYFEVFFKRLLSRVALSDEPFYYGPIIYDSISPSIGNAGGGDFIEIPGCGLSQFPDFAYSISVDGEFLCQPGSIFVFSDKNLFEDESLRCISAPVICGGLYDADVLVQVELDNGEEEVVLTTVPSIDTISYSVGPFFYTISNIRGPRTGGQDVIITGSGFYYYYGDSNTENPIISFRYYDEDQNELFLPNVTGTVISDTEIHFVTPVGLFDLDVEIFVTLDCSYDTGFNYHFGPTCNEVTPVNGWYTGGSTVTLIGEGFEEDDNLKSDTFVRMCIDRISSVEDDICAHEEVPRSSFKMNSTEISFETPSAREGIKTAVGYNRIYGDASTIFIHFYQPGGEFIEFPRNQLRPGLESARIMCPDTFYFGADYSTVSPSFVQTTASEDVEEPITIGGQFFADPNLSSDIHVLVDSIGSPSATINTDTQITANVPYGLPSQLDAQVNVIFDTRNETFSGIELGFGPTIYSLYAEFPNSPVNGDGDIYGLFPGGQEWVYVEGEHFLIHSDDGSDDEDNDGYHWYWGDDEDIGVYEIQCIIDGDEVPSEVISDGLLRCQTPCRPFGSKAALTLEFSYQLDSEAPILFSVTAEQYLWYNPRIDSFEPAYGRVSGGDTVTIHGEGFQGWGKYECFFGHYSDQQHAVPSEDGTSLVCKTPINRAVFNTWVTVSVQLSANDDDDDNLDYYNSEEQDQGCFNHVYVDESTYAAVENHNYKVWASDKFYYGPVCNDISPSSCPMTGCVASVVGTGFQDCVSGNQSVYTREYPYNDCIFRYYKIRFVDPVTGDYTYVNAPSNDTLSSGNSDNALFFYAPPRDCMFDTNIEIEFYTPTVNAAATDNGKINQAVIKCTTPESRPYTFRYGPVFGTQTSTYYDASTMTSYGWTGDSVTITGTDFRDPNIFTETSEVTCHFGDSLTSPASFVGSTGSVIVCPVPEVDASYWNAVVDISISWEQGHAQCTGATALRARKFHFGPTIRSITPTRGYVAGQEPVTIEGFALDCCGITSYSCLFPPVTPPKADDTVFRNNQITCTVPKNSNIDVLINNIGVSFTSSHFTAQNLTFTEQGTSLTYYYGPIVNSYSPDHSTLSGRDQFVTFSGVGFDDPYLIETFCDFFTETTPGFDYVSLNPIEEEYITATTITCPIPTFYHNAGAVDSIRPRWRRQNNELRPELGKFYYKTVPPPVANVDTAPYFSDGGSDVAELWTGFEYGPVITKICIDDICSPGATLPRVGLNPLQVTVYFDSLRDFVADGDTLDFGNQLALCKFGKYYSDSFVDIVANPDDDDGGHVVCKSPLAVTYDGEISVILNPNFLASQRFVSVETIPHVTGISRNWISAKGYETLVVYGQDFNKYSRVLCLFSNGVYASDSTMGDITSDRVVTCRTPPRTPGYITLSLQFFDGDCAQTEPLIEVAEKIIVYGITGMSPREGSICGGTTLTFSGYGFKFFESITCSWPNAFSLPATIHSDTSFSCTSIDLSGLFDFEFVHCSTLIINGAREGINYPLDTPSKYEISFPRIAASSPTSLDRLNLEPVVVEGVYLSGSGFNINCNYGDVVSVGTVELVNGVDVVVCNPPSSIDIGAYELSLTYLCPSGKSFESNTLSLEVTQTPIIDSIYPLSGPEIGGQIVTVSGRNFEGGNFYVCAFGDLMVGGNFDSDSNQITCKAPSLIGINDDVKVPLYISLDGGNNRVRSKDDYIYQNIQKVQNDVCVDDGDFEDNAGNHLGVSFVTLLIICIALSLNF